MLGVQNLPKSFSFLVATVFIAVERDCVSMFAFETSRLPKSG